MDGGVGGAQGGVGRAVARQHRAHRFCDIALGGDQAVGDEAKGKVEGI